MQEWAVQAPKAGSIPESRNHKCTQAPRPLWLLKRAAGGGGSLQDSELSFTLKIALSSSNFTDKETEAQRGCNPS